MCLNIWQKPLTKEDYIKLNKKIAKKDITVYKRLRLNGASPYKAMLYEEGFHYYQTGKKFGINFNEFSRKLEIERGLHSYKTLKRAKETTTYRYIIIEMVIPLGSEYFESDNDKEIVSDNLIWYKGAKRY